MARRTRTPSRTRNKPKRSQPDQEYFATATFTYRDRAFTNSSYGLVAT
ncbi:hypothetical protein ACFY9A_39115 [Streptomyces rubradiris]